VLSFSGVFMGEEKVAEFINQLILKAKSKTGDGAYRDLRFLVDLGDSAIPPLLNLLSDESSEVRYLAAVALDMLEAKSTEAVAALIIALQDTFGDVRSKAAQTLGNCENEVAVAPLINLLNDPQCFVRLEAVDALGKIGNARAVEPIIALLQDEDVTVRLAAVKVLGKFKDARAFIPLVGCLHDLNFEVSDEAAKIIGTFGTFKETTVLLIEALSDKSVQVRLNAAYALSLCGDAHAIQPLIRALADEHEDVRGNAAFALSQFKEKAVQPLIQATRSKNKLVRAEAANALGEIGDKKALGCLIDLLGDSEADVRGSAAYALEQIGDKHALTALQLLVNDLSMTRWGYTVRFFALNAINEIRKREGKL
jgi:HEAT repeat protein